MPKRRRTSHRAGVSRRTHTAEALEPRLPLDGVLWNLVAASGFNDELGLKSDAIPNSPYTIGGSTFERGLGELGWDGGWVVNRGGIAMDPSLGSSEPFAAYEGDGGLHLHGSATGYQGWTYRRLDRDVTNRVRIEQYVQLPSDGAVGVRPWGPGGSGTNGYALDWLISDGRFSVRDGGSFENTGIAASPGKWYEVATEIDIPSQTWEFFVDDVKYDAPDPLGFRQTVNAVRAVDYLVNADNDVYIDSIRVYEGVAPGLTVSSFNPTSSGFVAEFSGEVDAGELNQFDTETAGLGPPDVVLVGAATGLVSGSVVVDESHRKVEFIKTGGPLVADSYSVRLRSDLDGFTGIAANLMDGDDDGTPGGDFVASFAVEASHNTRVLAIPDFLRGPGQAVNIPADASSGIPIAISDGSGVQAIDLRIRYDPQILEIGDAKVAAGMPSGASLTINETAPGLAILSFVSSSPLPAGRVVFAHLEATVPADLAAELTANHHILDLQAVTVRDEQENELPATADDALHVIGYLGDASGDGRVTASDASMVARVAALVDSGFAARKNTDPVLVADVSGNGLVNALDASMVARIAAGIGVALPPRAVEDHYAVDEDHDLVVETLEGVLANDVDDTGNVLVATLVDDVENGRLHLAADGSFSYFPDPNFYGTDSFSYIAVSGNVSSESSNVTISVRPLSDPPVAISDVYYLDEDTLLSIDDATGPVVTSGLTNHYPLDIDAADVAGGNDGTLIGGAAIVGDPERGRALHLDGVDDYVSLAAGNTPLGPTESIEFSIAAWLKVPPGLDARKYGGGIYGEFWSGDSSARNFLGGFSEEPRELIFNQAPRDGGFLRGSTPLNDDTWHHVAYVQERRDGVVRREAYVDGVLDAFDDAAEPYYGPDPNLWAIGAHLGTHPQLPRNTRGRLDDIRFYDRALTATEVEMLTHEPVQRGLLVNDSDPDGDVLMATLVDDVQHGTLALNPDGTFEYTPEPNFSGTDSFTYQASDGANRSDTTTVTIHVVPASDPPLAVDDTHYAVEEDLVLTVDPSSGVLANDIDPDGDILTAVIVADAEHGALTLLDSGAFTYSPNPNFFGTDSFRYIASDGSSESEAATVTIQVTPVLDIIVGTHEVAADRADQTIELFVTDGHLVSGMNLFVQVGDGGPELAELGLPPGIVGPRITAADMETGTIFEGAATQIDLPGIPQFRSYSISVGNLADDVQANGLFVRLTIDTTGIFQGEFALKLGGILPELSGGPFASEFVGAPTSVLNGSIVVVPPSVVARHVFYNHSVFDGENPASDEADDLAIAIDKVPLLPGGTATFANYTSYSRGLNGIMVDIHDLRGDAAAVDFEFRAGDSIAPFLWDPAPDPEVVAVRRGAGKDGSDRVVLIWPDGAIRNRWLQVTAKASADLGLIEDDVFYFGNAVGETGNSLTSALVNSLDVIGARDHQQGVDDPAEIDNLFDFNRDRLVDDTDVEIARTHQTSPLNALRLISPIRPASAASINFEDGANGVPVDAFYASLGVTFADTVWFDEPTQVLHGSSPPFTIAHTEAHTHPKRDTPLLVFFSPPVTTVSIVALDVGQNGATMVAYDAAADGSVVDMDEVIGPPSETYQTLTVAALAIYRIELFQPRSVSGDGVMWDNLSFSRVAKLASAMSADGRRETELTADTRGVLHVRPRRESHTAEVPPARTSIPDVSPLTLIRLDPSEVTSIDASAVDRAVVTCERVEPEGLEDLIDDLLSWWDTIPGIRPR